MTSNATEYSGRASPDTATRPTIHQREPVDGGIANKSQIRNSEHAEESAYQTKWTVVRQSCDRTGLRQPRRTSHTSSIKRPTTSEMRHKPCWNDAPSGPTDTALETITMAGGAGGVEAARC